MRNQKPHRSQAGNTRSRGLALGRMQLRIMQVLWSRAEVTAREITVELNRGGLAPVAHSTVQTLLRQLEAKGMVQHEKQERTFVFRATQAREEIAATATRDLLTRIFDSSVSGMVAHLLRHESISREELVQLRQLIEDKEQQ